MIGWAAATGRLGPEAWSLFLIVFLWQFPHFLAIAWIYREDYRRAGFRMLTGRTMRGADDRLSGGLLRAGAGPGGPLAGDRSAWPGRSISPGRFLLGLFYLVDAARFWLDATDQRARRLLCASFLYLPAILILLLLNSDAVLTSRYGGGFWFLSCFEGSLHDGFRRHTARAHPAPAARRRPRPGPAPPGAGLARQGRDVAVPGHRGDVLHRADRLVHRAPRRQPARRPTAISTAPATPMAGHENTHGVLLKSAGESHDEVEHVLHAKAGLSEEEAKELVEQVASRRGPDQRAQAREGRGAARGAQGGRRRGRRRGAGDAQVAPALRRADQPAGHQPDGRQHVHPDLLVGHDGPGPRGHPGRQEGQGLDVISWPPS